MKRSQMNRSSSVKIVVLILEAVSFLKIVGKDVRFGGKPVMCFRVQGSNEWAIERNGELPKSFETHLVSR
jgi:hypothetical protein